MDDNPRLTVHDADARPFLRRTDERYDLIVVDAYHQPYVPFYLATREFFRLARDRLAPGGILALNVASVPGDERLLDGISGTLTHEFDVGRGLAGAALQQDPARVRRPRRARGRAGARCRPALQPLRQLLARQIRPVTEKAERPVDRRPRAGRVGDRPDDRRVRGPRRRARRGPPPDGAVRLLRGDGPLIRVGPPRRGRARAGEHAALVRGRARARRRRDRVRRARPRRRPARARALERPRRGQPRRGRRHRPRPLARRAARARAASCPRSTRRSRSSPTHDVALHVDLKLTTRLDELADGARAARPRRARRRQLLPPREPARGRARTRRRSRSASRTRRTATASRGGARSSRRSGSARSRCGARSSRACRAMIERAGAKALMLHHAVVSAAASSVRTASAPPSGPGRSTTRGARPPRGGRSRRGDHE